MAYQNTGIKSWSVADRPREKYKRLGSQKMTDAELLAILIANGYKGQSALTLAKTILASVANNVNELSELSLYDLEKFKGIGAAKAITIKAAMDLGIRAMTLTPQKENPVNSSVQAYSHLRVVFEDLRHEEFWVLYLNNANIILEMSVVGRGGFTATLVDIRLLLKRAIQLGALGLIVAHNHPSGNLQPSSQDKTLTLKLKKAAGILELKLLDHLVMGKGEYLSFADKNLL